MASEEMVLINELTMSGSRRIHVARMGRYPDLDEWLAKLPPCSFDTLNLARYVEKPLGVFHLWMCWRARETISLRFLDKSHHRWVVLWFIGRKARFRDAAAEAAERYFLDMGKDGSSCLARSIPAGAPTDQRVAVEVLGKTVELQLKVEAWVPRGYLVLEG